MNRITRIAVTTLSVIALVAVAAFAILVVIALTTSQDIPSLLGMRQ